MKFLIRNALALVAAALTTGIAASIVQTQFNIATLIDLDVPVPVFLRALVTLEDVARFGPVMMTIAAAALVPAMVAATVLSRSMSGKSRVLLFALAGVVGMWTTFRLLAMVSPMPALVAATGNAIGLASMCLTGAIGGAIYAGLSVRRSSTHDVSARLDRCRLLAGVALIVVPVIFLGFMAPKKAPPVDAVDPSAYVVETVASGLDRPWSVGFLPDGRRLVTLMDGDLLSISPEGTISSVSLQGLPPIFQSKGVGQLMEVVIDPEFAKNGLVYLSMGYGQEGANGTRVVRGRLDGDTLADVRIIFSSTPKPHRSNNGGRMAFLPDGTLVLTVGDGDVREQAQNLKNHIGKVVRIDTEGRAPADNPFHAQADAAPEVFSLGHRNAQGIAVDPATGALLVSEHGPRGGDEINVIEPGKNYGWPVATAGLDYSFARMTPFSRLAGYAAPVHEWTPSIAPAGLAVYTGTRFPDWQGDLLVPALKERAVRRVIRENGRIVGEQLLLAELGQRMRDVKVAPDGAIYVLTDGVDAKLLRLNSNTP